MISPTAAAVAAAAAGRWRWGGIFRTRRNGLAVIAAAVPLPGKRTRRGAPANAGAGRSPDERALHCTQSLEVETQV